MKHKTCHCQIGSIPDQDARMVGGNRDYGEEKITRRGATFFAEPQGGKVIFAVKTVDYMVLQQMDQATYVATIIYQC